MGAFVCLVTGPIVGLRSTHFLKETVAFAASIGKSVVCFDVFDEILSTAGLRFDNAYERLVRIGELLDGYEYQLELMRQNAYWSISRKIEDLPDGASAVVRAAASIEWRGVNVEFKDHRILAEALRPDRIVTLIDAERKIRGQLRTDYGQAAMRLVVQEQEPGIGMILRWLGSEVSRSEDWADWCAHLTQKPVRHYVLGVQIPGFADRHEFFLDVDNMTKAATEPELPSFYSSYSMTTSTPEVRDAINEALRRLRDYGLVIDPGSIEIGSNTGPEDEGVVFAYTVARDLRWDVRKVDTVAAFHLYRDTPPLSTGMVDELSHARAFHRERFMVLPKGGGSPFTAGALVPKNHLFTDTADFFGFLEKRRRPVLRPRFTEQSAAFVEWQKARAGSAATDGGATRPEDTRLAGEATKVSGTGTAAQ